MDYPCRNVFLFAIPLFVFVLTGCDSGGGNSEQELGETITLKVEGASDSMFDWNVVFFYDQEGGSCPVAGPEGSGSARPPFEQKVDPGDIERSSSECPPEGTDVNDFDGVLGNVTVQEQTENLTVRLFSDGKEISVANESDEEGIWRVEAGSVPDFRAPVKSGHRE